MADDNKLYTRLLLIGLAVVILAILITQYKKKTFDGIITGESNGREQFSLPHERYTTQEESMRSMQSMPSMQSMQSMPSTQSMYNKPPMPNQMREGFEQVSKEVLPSDPMTSSAQYKAVNFDVKTNNPGECAPRDKLSAEDLLPKDAANSKWATVAPAGQGAVTDSNLLTAGYLIGVNTVGETLKNSNMQLRSDPPIERLNIGPWQMSTIEKSPNRRQFEIGSC
jgi:hypothetical protein